jgi:hypothetical protein
VFVNKPKDCYNRIGDKEGLFRVHEAVRIFDNELLG